MATVYQILLDMGTQFNYVTMSFCAKWRGLVHQ